MATARRITKTPTQPNNNATITIKDGKVFQEINLGNVSKVEDRNLISFFTEIARYTPIDTGLIPLDGSGMLSHRHALESTQIVYQQAPGKYHIHWGANEYTRNKEVFYLAQPWRVWIADLYQGELLGIRHFYSPYPVQSPDQQLYHVNLPNLNCKGYRGTSVGWICLYHKHQWGDAPLAEKIRYLTELAGGGEAYNDGNMRQTDGPRFYQAAGKPQYTWDPKVWEAKTETEGVAWTLDPDLWIPIKVTDVDNQSQHVENGVPLTLDMAMKGNYQAYYTDTERPKPFNGFARADVQAPSAEVISTYIGKSFVTAKKDFTGGVEVVQHPAEVLTNPELQIVSHCHGCGEPVYSKDIQDAIQDHDGIWCVQCAAKNYIACKGCNQKFHYEYMQYWNADETYWCGGCKTIATCGHCGAQHEDLGNIVNDDFCTSCADTENYGTCQMCDRKVWSNLLAEVPALNEEKVLVNYNLCENCRANSVTCGCGFIRTAEAIVCVDTSGKACCQPCTWVNPNSGMAEYRDPNYLPAGLSAL